MVFSLGATRPHEPARGPARGLIHQPRNNIPQASSAAPAVLRVQFPRRAEGVMRVCCAVSSPRTPHTPHTPVTLLSLPLIHDSCMYYLLFSSRTPHQQTPAWPGLLHVILTYTLSSWPLTHVPSLLASYFLPLPLHWLHSSLPQASHSHLLSSPPVIISQNTLLTLPF